MKYDTSELCDIYQEDVNVVEPLFSNFGGRASFGGQIITVKCFEDNGLLYDLLEQNGSVVVFLSSMAEVLFVAHWSMLNWRVWQYKMNGKVWSFTARCVR